MNSKRCLTLFAALLAFVVTLPPAALCQQATDSLPATRSPGRPKVGLALGGGGTRGACHVGVLRVLKEEGIPIDVIAGTSMGAIVGGLYSAGVTLDTLEEDFQDVSLMRAFMTVPLWVRLVASPILIIPRLVGFRPYDGLYRGNKFRKYLDQAVPKDKLTIESFSTPFCAVALNLLDSKVHRICKGDIGYALQASSAVPGLRKPVDTAGGLFVDGGVAANVPVEQAREMGADIVIAVNADERLTPMEKDTFRHVGSVAEYMVKFSLAFIDAPQLKQADIVIHPNVDGIGLVSTKRDDALKAMKAGEEAARAALPQIKARLSQVGVAGMDQVH